MCRCEHVIIVLAKRSRSNPTKGSTPIQTISQTYNIVQSYNIFFLLRVFKFNYELEQFSRSVAGLNMHMYQSHIIRQWIADSWVGVGSKLSRPRQAMLRRNWRECLQLIPIWVVKPIIFGRLSLNPTVFVDLCGAISYSWWWKSTSSPDSNINMNHFPIFS